MSDYTGFQNYIACVCLIRGGKPEKLIVNAEMAGERPRTAWGIREDGTHVFCCTGESMTPEALRSLMAEQGCQSALMLDGGGSSQCVFPNGMVESSRIVHNLILIWESRPYIKGIDVSSFQGAIDWEKARPEIGFAILRAGYGKNNIDSRFYRNINECNRLNIPCGVYWFSYAYTEKMARAEAAYCLDAIRSYRVEYPVCYDFEYDSVKYAAKNGVQATEKLASGLCRAFCEEIEAAGYYAMNYTNPDFLSRYYDSSTRKYDLWLADWRPFADLGRPAEGQGIWQYASDGSIPGIIGKVDLDAAYRDYAKVIKDAGLNRPGPNEAEEAVKKLVRAGWSDILIDMANKLDGGAYPC
jgi:GH25 family lysozyme M1 (1,4-beta-N-acetylmuramidase)